MPPISQPETLSDALAARAAHPGSTVIAGGTGVMVGRNAGVGDAPLLDLSRVGELAGITQEAGVLRLGAGVTYTQVIEELAGPAPVLAAAARTVASRQIRNRATLAGALVLADPSADVLAALVAADAEVEIGGPRGARRVGAGAFVRGPGRPDLAPDELVTALLVPAAGGPGAYAKAGARNAMARAVCGVAVALDPARRSVRIAVVGAGPAAVRTRLAEDRAAAAGAWGTAAPFGEADLTAVGELVATAVDPTGDARGSAAYRRRIAAVLSRRALARAWSDLRRVPVAC